MKPSILNMSITSIQATAAKWVLAKGITFTILTSIIIVLCYAVIKLDSRTEVLQMKVDEVYNKTIEIEKDVIKENTKELAKFNLMNSPPRSSSASVQNTIN